VGSVVAAISISGPASRLTPDRFVSQGELVRETAILQPHCIGKFFQI
jgi:IclR family negative regulator of allantoin and glyoxylate utilization operon